MVELSAEEKNRYARHLSLKEVGEEGQKKLKAAKVLIIGAGGLGSPAAYYLVAAGVGTIGIIDFDKVDESNLQRQILHSAKTIGMSKVDSAKETLLALNPYTTITTYEQKLTSENALTILKGYDIIVDGSDNFPAKYLINDACALSKKPLVMGSIFQFQGQVSVFHHQNGPCYRCLVPNPPNTKDTQSCAQVGVLGVLPGVIGTIQATEVIKIILKKGNILSKRYLLYNALDMTFNELALSKRKDCPLCSENPKITALIDYEEFCKGHDMNQKNNEEITAKELKEKWPSTTFELIDVRERDERQVSNIAGSKHIPLSHIQKGDFGIIDSISKDKPIVLHCASGRRSAHVLELLKKKGYKHLKNLVGGIKAWKEEE